MLDTLLRTKLFIPPLRPDLVSRRRLIKQLNQGLHLGRKLTLISAPAGFGKTTLASEWVTACGRPVAWLSLDEGENDPTRFLAYFVTALQKLAQSDVEGSGPEPAEGTAGKIGEGVSGMLQSSQPQPSESILTALLNEISNFPDSFVLVLDDYHVIDAQPVANALTFLLEHLPPQMHLVIVTREDPDLPLARYRAGGHLGELRAAELRFTFPEAAEFLRRVMGLSLSAEEIALLEARTEGWIAGLQLAALSIQGRKDSTGLIEGFSGSHHFVLDYLVEEVLQGQPERVQMFLIKTAVLDRLSGSLCDSLTGQDDGQATLEMLERINLFIVPLDSERRWYRYHHLFADLLRQRLSQSSSSSARDEGMSVAELHIRASEWYEANGLEIEAFRHAAAANDIERAERLIEGEGVPLQYRGASATVLNWLATLPTSVLDARPSLLVTYASALNFAGHPSDAEQKLQAAEAILQGIEANDKINDIIGHIAAIRAMMAVGQNQIKRIIDQSQRALQYLNPDNLTVRTITTWTLGYAYQLLGDRAAARKAYSDVISISQVSGDIISTLAATTGLGQLYLEDNQLLLAAESYRRGVQLFKDGPQPVACETYLGLARILYEWNDLDAAEEYGQQSLRLAQQVEGLDTYAVCGAFLARLKLARGDLEGADALLATADEFMRQNNFVDRMPEVVRVQVRSLLRQGKLEAAADLAEKHKVSISKARVQLALGNSSAAVTVLESFNRQAMAEGRQDERLKAMVLQTVALHAHGEEEEAVQLLGEVLALAEPGGFIRTFVDEGRPMALLLIDAHSLGIAPDTIRRLLEAIPDIEIEQVALTKSQAAEVEMIEILSERELEVLGLIAQGLTYRQIAEQLIISLNTVRSHTKNIYGKLGANNRTQAIQKAHDLNLL